MISWQNHSQVLTSAGKIIRSIFHELTSTAKKSTRVGIELASSGYRPNLSYRFNWEQYKIYEISRDDLTADIREDVQCFDSDFRIILKVT